MIIEERNSRIENRPASLFGEAMSAALYRNHRYGVPIIGWRHEIEGLTKEYGCDIIISQTTFNLLTESYDTKPLDRVKVKGKKNALIIHQLL